MRQFALLFSCLSFFLFTACQQESLVNNEFHPDLSKTEATPRESAVFPSVIPLPNGFAPEGIVNGRGSTFFAGSLVDGTIVKGDFRTGEIEILVGGQPGEVAVGLAYDSRSDYLFVSGGPTGAATVYDATTGEEVAAFQLSTTSSFINDVTVTRTAAFFTDSFNPVLYKVPLGPAGRLPDASAIEELPLTGDFQFVSGAFNANGIVGWYPHDSLIIISSATATLYNVDAETGETQAIDLGGATLPNGDGLVLDGKTLYVVQNFLNQIAVVRLSPDHTSGEILGTITDPNFRIPTTADDFGNYLYAVNARFDVAPEPTVEYEVVRVRK